MVKLVLVAAAGMLTAIKPAVAPAVMFPIMVVLELGPLSPTVPMLATPETIPAPLAVIVNPLARV